MTPNKKVLILHEWRDNSMGNNKIRISPKFEGFSFIESRLVSYQAIKLAGQLADQLEKDLASE